jgi:hypothetical protein
MMDFFLHYQVRMSQKCAGRKQDKTFQNMWKCELLLYEAGGTAACGKGVINMGLCELVLSPISTM